MAVVIIPANFDGTAGWTELTAGAAPSGMFQFQNIGTTLVRVKYLAAAPAASEPGDRFEPSQGDRLNASTLRAWAKNEPGTDIAGKVNTTFG